MHRIQILLDPEMHQILVEIARNKKRSLSDIVREMLQRQLEEHKAQTLEMAAKALLEDYQNDAELSAFTVDPLLPF